MLLHSVYICNCASPAVLRLEPKWMNVGLNEMVKESFLQLNKKHRHQNNWMKSYIFLDEFYC